MKLKCITWSILWDYSVDAFFCMFIFPFLFCHCTMSEQAPMAGTQRSPVTDEFPTMHSHDKLYYVNIRLKRLCSGSLRSQEAFPRD